MSDTRFPKNFDPDDAAQVWQCDPADAQWVLANWNVLPGQRPLNQRHVGDLADRMRRGTFRARTKIEVFRVGDAYFLGDGQHTLAAIAASERPQQLWVLIEEVGSVKEAQQRYATFDRDMIRSSADALKALGTGVELGLSDREANAFAAAVVWPQYDFRPQRDRMRDMALVAGAMQDWRAAADLYFAIAATVPAYLRRSLLKVPVLAAGLATMIEPAEQAEEFWTGVAGDEVNPGDPRKALILYCLTGAGRGSTLNKIRTVSSTWNAFVRGKELEIAKPTGHGMYGVTLLGTRFRATVRPKRRPTASSDVVEEARP